MLHVGILPNHPAWAELFANLAVVVVDEAHVYRGVFGSHVANVLRRLRRIAAAYGTAPRFLLTSATIANPVELAERLTGLEDVSLIDVDGSPAPGRRIAIWNPPLTDEELGQRRSALGEAAELLARLVRDGARADLLHEVAQGRRDPAQAARRRPGARTAPELARARGPLPRRLHPPAAPRARGPPRPRRAARGDHDRRARARDRHRRARRRGRRHVPRDRRLAAPDVGARRAARPRPRRLRRGRGRARPVLLPPPRRLPRAPRRGGDPRPRERRRSSAATCSAPRTRGRCRARTPSSSARAGRPTPRSCRARASCAAGRAGQAERRAGAADPGERGPVLSTYVPRDPAATPPPRSRCARPRPTASRSSTSPPASCSARPRPRAPTRPCTRARSTCTSGAPTRSANSTSSAAARSSRRSTATGTRSPSARPTPTIERLLDRREALGVTLCFGEVAVTDTVLAYQRRRLSDHAQIDLSGSTCRRRASPRRRSGSSSTHPCLGLGDAIPPGGACSARSTPTEHAQIAVLPLIAMCDRWDIGGLSTNLHPQTGGATIFIYDGHPGGIGITRTAFARFEELCRDAHRLIAECPCASGCPSCVQSPKCGNLNEPLSKAGARLLLERMLGAGGGAVAETSAKKSAGENRSERGDVVVEGITMLCHPHEGGARRPGGLPRVDRPGGLGPHTGPGLRRRLPVRPRRLRTGHVLRPARRPARRSTSPATSSPGTSSPARATSRP